MKNTFQVFAARKKADLLCQCGAFVLMLSCLPFFYLFSLYILAIAQCISSIIWLALDETPQKTAHRGLRGCMVSVCTLLSLMLLIVPYVFWMASMVMLIVGPILGISYFVTTVKEYRYFTNARKLYYEL